MLTSILRTSPNLFQAFELHLRKPSFLVGLDGRYTQRIFAQLGVPPPEFATILNRMAHAREPMNLGAWIGPKEQVSAEPLSGRETDDFEGELHARGELLTRLMRRAAELHDRQRWVFKILGDVVHANTYARVWPNATFILIVRDPRDQALSVMKLNEDRAKRGQPNFYDDYAAAATGWLRTVVMGKRVLEANGIDHVVLRYEDLVRSPVATLQHLSHALDIDLSNGLNFYRRDFDDAQAQRFRHHNNLKNPVSAKSVEKWRLRMSDEELAVFGHIAGDAMRAYGYEVRRKNQTHAFIKSCARPRFRPALRRRARYWGRR